MRCRRPIGTLVAAETTASPLANVNPSLPHFNLTLDSAIFYDSSVVKAVEQGTFWVCPETPNLPGCIFPNSSLPRVITWALFQHKQTSQPFFVYNVHLDYFYDPSRVAAVQLMVTHMERMSRCTIGDPWVFPTIAMGDFNNALNETAAEEFQILRNATFIDTFRVARPDAYDNVGTFHGFTGDPGGDRIDYVWVRMPVDSNVTVVDASIDRTHRDNRFPSDHFAIRATLNFFP
jgi:endonuclease/exonuclease/phosphatase family metal-dependent hydrolase